MAAGWVLGAAGVVIARNPYGRRHWRAWNVARFLLYFLGVLALCFLAHLAGLRGWWIIYLASGLSAPPFLSLQWKRSRRIPAATRRKVIEKWEARTGKTFDPKLYEIDHKIPFAKGGWHTLDNLRVVRKTANRKKGHREPKLEDWFDIWRRKDED